MFPGCPNIATLAEHSANIPGILRAVWKMFPNPWVDKAILTPSDILTPKYHKYTSFHEYFIIFSLFYLFDFKFVDLMIFSFFQGKIYAPKKSDAISWSVF